MNIIEQFLRKVSYKFPKGYPDINDPKDWLMLEGMLKEIGINLNELTVSPSYQSRGIPNPFYTVTPETDSKVRDILNKKNIPFKNVIYKAVEDVKKEPLISTGKFSFELFDDTDTSLNVFIKIPKNKVVAHYGTKSRKDSTASSNVNEFLSLYFLLHPQFTTVDDLEGKEGGTGVLRGEGEEVTYAELIELINKDETPEKDIKIGFNNAQALKKDLKGKSIAAYYWTPRQKPANINPSNPSDIILQLENGDFIGYSNKIAEGADKTPKFNTNITAFFSKIGEKEEDIKSMIDKAWEDAATKVPSSSPTAKKAINNFNIRGEAFSESKSREAFATLALQFKEDNLDFFGKDFYHIFRNNLISSLIDYLKTPSNLKYFLNTIAVYTYGQKVENETPCPYKLLIGSVSSSTIKEVSDNSLLKSVVTIDSTNDIKQIDFSWNGNTQTFDIKYNQLIGTGLHSIVIPVTVRTRSAPHWSGKSLYITTPGVEIL